MGQLTRTQIITAGLTKAGVAANLSTLAVTWLNAWLRSQYAAWPWPWLQARVSGIALPAGTASLLLGAGSSGVTPEIKRIHDPIWVYDSAYTTKTRARISPLLNGDISTDETLTNPLLNRGCPTSFKVRADSTLWGRWTLIPFPVPDKAYLLAADYQIAPADLTSDSAVPMYPNDRTLIQAVVADALDYSKDYDAAQLALQVLSNMTIDDRIKYGEVTGINDQFRLDPNNFK